MPIVVPVEEASRPAGLVGDAAEQERARIVEGLPAAQEGPEIARRGPAGRAMQRWGRRQQAGALGPLTLLARRPFEDRLRLAPGPDGGGDRLGGLRVEGIEGVGVGALGIALAFELHSALPGLAVIEAGQAITKIADALERINTGHVSAPIC